MPVEFKLNGKRRRRLRPRNDHPDGAAARRRDPAPLLQGRHAPGRQLPRVHGRNQGRARAGALVLPQAGAGHGSDERQRARGRIRRKWCSSCCCPTCPRSAHTLHSELDQWAASWKSASRVSRRATSRPPISRISAMAVNLDSCIQCTRCVRACREEQVNDVIGYAFRGEHSKIVFDLDDPMGDSTCVACGECVQACPTGALMPARDVGMVEARQAGAFGVPVLRRRLPAHVQRQGQQDPVRRRPRRPGEPRAPVRQRPLRLRLRASQAAPDEAADPQARRAEIAPISRWIRRIRSSVSAKRAGTRRSSSPAQAEADIRDASVAAGVAGFGSAKGTQRRGVPVPEARAHRLRHATMSITARACATRRASRRCMEGVGSGAVSNQVTTSRTPRSSS